MGGGVLYSRRVQGSDTSVTSSASVPVSVRANNPLNIKSPGWTWNGEVGEDSQGHVIFDNQVSGYRAASIDILHKFKRGSVNTIHQLTCIWAEANCDNYARFVALRVGVEVDQTLSYTDVVHNLALILDGMALWESGHYQTDFTSLTEGMNQGIRYVQNNG